MPRYEDLIPLVPAGHRVRTIRRYPGEAVERAVARAGETKWWPRRTSDQPVAMTARRWAWIAAWR